MNGSRAASHKCRIESEIAFLEHQERIESFGSRSPRSFGVNDLPVGEVNLDRGVIVAARHIHMHPDQAVPWGIRDGQRVRIRVESERPLVFDDVLVRVNPQYQGEVHLDTDEANAALVKTGATALILGV